MRNITKIFKKIEKKTINFFEQNKLYSSKKLWLRNIGLKRLEPRDGKLFVAMLVLELSSFNNYYNKMQFYGAYKTINFTSMGIEIILFQCFGCFQYVITYSFF